MRTAVLLSLVLFAGCKPSSSRVVVYSAQDPEYAEQVFRHFEGNGLSVAPKYDTEANKSVSLVVELEQEAGRPRCDVHWNNEPLGTIRLARKGVYEPYESPEAAFYPPWSKPKERTWQAFAERARVLVVNTNLVPEAERPKSLLDLADPKWKGKVAIAKPQFGTTATQAACLFELLGPDAAKSFYRALKTNEVHVVAGNKQAATGVSDGKFAVGLTDSDDAVAEVNAGKPVAIIFPDAAGHPAHPRLGTLYLPNTLAVVKGAPNPAGARKLVDFLLGPTIEQQLAEGGGYQFPLHPSLTFKAHPALTARATAKRAEVDFEKAADLWDETQTFLRNEFAR
jgi:iron(III) transport system substrate-binding protein